MYVLVLLHTVPGGPADVDHEPFIDSLIARDLVVTGGPFLGDNAPAAAAYVLRVLDLPAAEAVVATDPLITSGACTAQLVQWDLVQ